MTLIGSVKSKSQDCHRFTVIFFLLFQFVGLISLNKSYGSYVQHDLDSRAEKADLIVSGTVLSTAAVMSDRRQYIRIAIAPKTIFKDMGDLRSDTGIIEFYVRIGFEGGVQYSAGENVILVLRRSQKSSLGRKLPLMHGDKFLLKPSESGIERVYSHLASPILSIMNGKLVFGKSGQIAMSAESFTKALLDIINRR